MSKLTSSKIQELLKRPYRRIFILNEDRISYTSYIEEFQGCISFGYGIEEANRMLEEAATLWLTDQQEDSIPPPKEEWIEAYLFQHCIPNSSKADHLYVAHLYDLEFLS